MGQIFHLEPTAGGVRLTGYHGFGPEAEIPAGVTEIAADVFRGSGLRSVRLPDSLRRIGRRAFQHCRRLTALELPEGVREIDSEAFGCCDSLRTLRLSAQLEEIGDRAFWYCAALESLTVPARVRRIGPRAFESCSRLRAVELLSPDTQVDEGCFYETPYYLRLLQQAESCRFGRGGTEHVVLPEGMTHVEHWAFAGSAIRTAQLPNSLRTMGMCAFQNCRQLRSVSLSPNTYCNYRLPLSPGEGIFAGCERLERVVLRGALRPFTWHDADRPQVLRGFDRERTFAGCGSLRELVAWELPLDTIPELWRQYALTAFVTDPDRAQHYAPAVQPAYHTALAARRQQLLRRVARDPGFGLCQYLMERRWITAENFDTILAAASAAGADPQTLAALLAYRAEALRPRDSLLSALDAL